MRVSLQPQVKTMQNADWEQQSTSNQKAPQTLCKTSKDVSEPGGNTRNAKNLIHKFFLNGGKQC
jgi:hypothetical protein